MGRGVQAAGEVSEDTIDAVFECKPCKGRGWTTHYTGGGGGRYGCQTHSFKCRACGGTGIEGGGEEEELSEVLAEIQRMFPK